MISLPPAFIQRMERLLGDEAKAFFQSLDSELPTSIRINTEKSSIANIPFQNLLFKEIPWCNTGYYLKERPLFILDPYLHGGAYYVQEASSMFLQTVLQQIIGNTPLRILDLCAAPGGKSTLLANNMPMNSLLVSNEVIKSRAVVLKENIIKWGLDNVVVTNSDPSRFSQVDGAFDIILVDAPCSGEGMFRKDEKAITEWSENNLRLCEERQKRIISDVWTALAPGGFLIYSTCTYNPGENEDMLNWILKTFDSSSIEIQHGIPEITNSQSPLHAYHFYPHKTLGEGFFIGVIQKNDGTFFSMKKGKRDLQATPIKLPTEIHSFLPDITKFSIYLAGETLGILPKQHAEFVQYLSTRAGVIYKGCEIGESMKGKIKPAHSLALYSKLQQKQVAHQEVDLPTALQFLRKEEIRFDAPRGEWILVTYKGLGLGWVKEVGNRINNYYPKEWRIKNF